MTTKQIRKNTKTFFVLFLKFKICLWMTSQRWQNLDMMKCTDTAICQTA